MRAVNRGTWFSLSLLVAMVFSVLPAVARVLCDEAAAKSQNVAEVLSFVEMGQPASEGQLAGDWYAPEEGRFRWMGKEAAVYLETPREKSNELQVEFYLTEDHIREVGSVVLQLELNGKLVDRQKYDAPGFYTYRVVLLPEQVAAERVCVGLSVGKTFQPTGEKRLLGLAVSNVGFLLGEKRGSP
ncbi:MAG: hypothetical protein HY647_13840 [Acidobacteria bacterium]|nr:hypothetical protein [Acidobacteriota bacterium]